MPASLDHLCPLPNLFVQLLLMLCSHFKSIAPLRSQHVVWRDLGSCAVIMPWLSLDHHSTRGYLVLACLSGLGTWSGYLELTFFKNHSVDRPTSENWLLNVYALALWRIGRLPKSLATKVFPEGCVLYISLRTSSIPGGHKEIQLEGGMGGKI